MKFCVENSIQSRNTMLKMVGEGDGRIVMSHMQKYHCNLIGGKVLYVREKSVKVGEFFLGIFENLVKLICMLLGLVELPLMS